jgi:ADP-dependent NAD(P)H-hydrate dehydratase / NAD(P)H-hydrate epimerase
VRAVATVSFITAKPGLETGAGRRLSGERIHVSLGVPAAAFSGQSSSAIRFRQAALTRWMHPRRPDAHKGDHGRVLCIGGDHGFGGAIRLCAEAALRCGSGLVSVATRPLHVAALLAARPELMVHGVDDQDQLDALLASAGVLALGPGLGRGDWAHGLWRTALASGRPCVLDADGLNLLCEGGHALPSPCILTPHPGEAARLLECAVAEVEADRFGAAQTLAARFGAVVVLKGPGSIVADEGRPSAVIDAGNPGMAVGGMGDVLTGVIAGMLAQGLDPWDAAVCGTLLHACAGDRAAHEGQRGLLPLDLMPEIRRLANPSHSEDQQS